MKKRFFYIYLSFGLSLTIFILLSFLFYERLNSLMRFSNEVETKYNIISKLEQVASYLKDVETAQRGYIITKDSVFLNPLTENIDKIYPLIDSIKTMADNKYINEQLILLRQHVSERISQAYKTLANSIDDNPVQLYTSLLAGKRLMDLCRADISKMQAWENKQLDEYFHKKIFYEKITPNYLSIVLLFATAIMIVSFFLIVQEFKRRIESQYQLERRVAELDRANAELEQLTFVASHDLQEPLRKIRTFTDWLLHAKGNQLDEEIKQKLRRIDNAALNMHGFMNDIVEYTNLLQLQEKLRPVNIKSVTENVIKELAKEIERKKATISIEATLIINGYSNQLHLLFKALIDNSLKFSKAGEPPAIKIIFTKEEGRKQRMYNKIAVADNGIGFSNEFSEKIFVIFQRLHSAAQKDYKGKGIGLAIVQRVMINHGGYVEAAGIPDNGATINLYFPE